MAYGGFRGTVGIGKWKLVILHQKITHYVLTIQLKLLCIVIPALSLTLYVTLTEELEDHSSQNSQEYKKNVQMLFSMVGGISLFTLLVSGLTSKPLLQWVSLSIFTCIAIAYESILSLFLVYTISRSLACQLLKRHAKRLFQRINRK